MTTIEDLEKRVEALEMNLPTRRGIVAYLYEHDLKFQRLEEGQQRHEHQLRALNNKFDGLENKFDGLESKFDVLENKVDAGLSRLDQKIDTSLSRLDDKLDILLAQSKINLD